MFPLRADEHGNYDFVVIVKLNSCTTVTCGPTVASGVPHGYQIEALHGFIEELVVNDDPEYQWIDKIRSMRASNEARQMQFSKLSGNSVAKRAM